MPGLGVGEEKEGVPEQIHLECGLFGIHRLGRKRFVFTIRGPVSPSSSSSSSAAVIPQSPRCPRARCRGADATVTHFSLMRVT